MPSTTSGGGWIASTGYISPTLITPAPYTTISGVWQSDGTNATGDPSEFLVSTNDLALVAIPNGRVPATWLIRWTSSQSYPQCDGLETTATPGAIGAVEEINCIDDGTLEGESSPFTFSPNIINLSSPPETSSISGSGFMSTYGMPQVQYFSSQGTLVAQATATYVSPNGTLISAPTPNLSSVPAGSYVGVISNIDSTGSLVNVGAVSVTISSLPSPTCPAVSALAISPEGVNPCGTNPAPSP